MREGGILSLMDYINQIRSQSVANNVANGGVAECCSSKAGDFFDVFFLMAFFQGQTSLITVSHSRQHRYVVVVVVVVVDVVAVLRSYQRQI